MGCDEMTEIPVNHGTVSFMLFRLQWSRRDGQGWLCASLLEKSVPVIWTTSTSGGHHALRVSDDQSLTSPCPSVLHNGRVIDLCCYFPLSQLISRSISA